MSLSESPKTADKIIAFDGESSVAATLNYSVPLPGRLRNRRIVELKGLVARSQFNTGATKPVVSTEAAGYDSNARAVDDSVALEFYLRSATAAGIRADIVLKFRQEVSAQLDTGTYRSFMPSEVGKSALNSGVALANVDITRGAEALKNGYLEFKAQLKEGNLYFPKSDANGHPSGNSPVTHIDPIPRFFIVEYYEISSFLGDYGLGKTVRTYSLFPGERVTIRLRTWRSSEEKRSTSSTIFDSFDETVNERFGGEVRSETTDSQTQSKKEEWHAEAKVGASWGFGSAEVSGGGSGQYQSGREQFSSGVNQATQEHGKTASAKRDNTVTSSTENTNKTENEESIEREIKNVNLRRVLNFVFRELNQEYLTKVSLVDVRIAFSNGTGGSWREVPISQLRPMLSEVLKETEVDSVATKILGLIGTVFDHEDSPHTVLEKIEFYPQGQDYVSPPAIAVRDAGGQFAAPTETLIYRFRRGPIQTIHSDEHAFNDALSERHAKFQVPGVVLKQDAIVLRTDSLVVEALLGQADALDQYAMLSQKADAEAKQIANDREKLLNEGLSDIEDGKERLETYAGMVVRPQPLQVDFANREGN